MDVEAAWGLATGVKIEKQKPEEREEWAIPQTGNAWEVAPPSNRGNPYRTVGTPKGSDRLPAPSTATRGGSLWTVEGNASWGKGTMTKKVLDPKQTEGMIHCVPGEHTRKDASRYIYCPVLVATSLVLG